MAPETRRSLEPIARVTGLAAHTTATQQGLSERLTPAIEAFLARVIPALLGQLSRAVPTSPACRSFARVVVQDRTVETLPQHLAKLFPASGHQHGHDYAALKIQWICDLKNSAAAHVSLSGFTRNDQAAAPDLLPVARRGDLVLRDLGSLTRQVLAQCVEAQISFLTRHRHGIHLYDPQSGQPLDLKAQ